MKHIITLLLLFLVCFCASSQTLKGDTLILKIDTKIKFIKIGETVFELNVTPSIKEVTTKSHEFIDGGILIPSWPLLDTFKTIEPKYHLKN